MAQLAVFNSLSLDGFFSDENGDMSFAHNLVPDPEWDAFVSSNAGGDGVLLFGRVTYDLMAGFWPTPLAIQQMPEVANGMNRMPKIVFSRTLEHVSWKNTRLFKTDLPAEVRRMKQTMTEDMVILGSGSIVSQLTDVGLIDSFQIVIVPVVLGKGKTMFGDVRRRIPLRLVETKTFANGNVVITYRT